MIHHLIQEMLPEIISLFELIGIIVILLGGINAIIKHIMAVIKHSNTTVKVDLGQALALGLEFKMGAEILNTVLITDFHEVGILAAIIGLRVILSLVIHLELRAESVEHKLELEMAHAEHKAEIGMDLSSHSKELLDRERELDERADDLDKRMRELDERANYLDERMKKFENQ